MFSHSYITRLIIFMYHCWFFWGCFSTVESVGKSGPKWVADVYNEVKTN